MTYLACSAREYLGPVDNGLRAVLHHVQVSMPAGDEAAGRAFYIGVLGFHEIEKPPVLAARGGFWLRAGALELHVGVEDDFQPARKAHPGILVTDIDVVAQRLDDANVPVRWDDDFPGHRRFYVEDCWGNRLEFLSPE